MSEPAVRPNDVVADIADSYDRLTEDELGNLGIVLGAYRSLRGDRRNHIAYVSMPITSGKRFYDVLSAHAVTTADELAAKAGKGALYEMVIKPNIDEGILFADQLGETRKDLLFIAPSVFEAKRWRWSQDAYMALWYRVIGELAGKHYLMDGWEYSTGGLKEVLFSMLMRWRVVRSHNLQPAAAEFRFKNFHPGLNGDQLWAEIKRMWEIRIYEADGSELRLDQALSKAVAAIADLRARGFACDELANLTWLLSRVPWRSPFLMTDMSPDGDPTPMSALYKASCDSLRQIDSRDRPAT